MQVWFFMSQIEENLEALCKLAKKLGATNAVTMDAGKVAVDERVRLKCRVPVCDDYGLNLMCPPFAMSVQEFRDALARYSRAVLVQVEMPMPAPMKEEIKQAEDVAALYKSSKFLESYGEFIDPVKLKLHRMVHEMESQAFALGYRFAAGFIAGSCKLCKKCVAASSHKSCRNPFRARPSMEAVGIDAYKTAKNAGLPFDIPAKDKITWNGLVLVT